MRFIDPGQQFYIGCGIALGKTMPTIDRHLNFPVFLIALDETSHLRPTPTCHLLHVLPQQPPHATTLLPVLMMHQHLLYPACKSALVFSPRTGSLRWPSRTPGSDPN